MVKFYPEGFAINGATPSSFYVSSALEPCSLDPALIDSLEYSHSKYASYFFVIYYLSIFSSSSLVVAVLGLLDNTKLYNYKCLSLIVSSGLKGQK